jgi:hypothetical protein
MFIPAQTVSPQAQDDCGMGKQPGCPGAIRSHRFSSCKGPFEIEEQPAEKPHAALEIPARTLTAPQPTGGRILIAI